MLHPPHVNPLPPAADRGWMWSFGVRAAIIFVVCMPFWTYPLGFGTRFYAILQKSTSWLHDHVFGVLGFDLSRLSNPGVGSNVEMAMAGAIFWLWLDSKRLNEDALQEILCVLARYALGGVMVGIGFVKVFPIQMDLPDPVQLMQPLGQPDDMWPAWGLMARTIGSSPLYQMYTGWLEAVGGLLLFFRRTTMLGTLLVSLELAAVLVMSSDTANFAEPTNFNWIAGAQVPAALILLAFQWRHAADFFFLNRATAPAPPHAWAWLKRFEGALRFAFAFALLASLYHTVLTWHDRRFHSPLTGVYEVDRFTRNGQSESTAMDAGRRWRLVAIDDCSRFAIRTIDDTSMEFAIVFPVKVETRARRECLEATEFPQGTLTLSAATTPDPTRGARADMRLPFSIVRYGRVAADELDLEGEIAGDAVKAHLRRVGKDRFALIRDSVGP